MKIEGNKKIFYIIGLLIIILLIILICFNENITFQKFALNFNNILTPIMTFSAFIVYYLSLRLVKKQTESINEEKKILQGENHYKDYLLDIQKLKEIGIKTVLSDQIKSKIIKSPFNNFSVYNGIITGLIDDLKKDKKYQKLINLDENDEINETEFSQFSEDKIYMSLNSVYHKYSKFLFKILTLLQQIEEDIILHETHKKSLIGNIAKELLPDYFLLVSNKDNFNYYLCSLNPKNNKIFKKLAFDLFNIAQIFNLYRDKYPIILDQTIINQIS